MSNEIETIDNVRGEWRTVTKASHVVNGQRQRYEKSGLRYGYSTCGDKIDRQRFFHHGDFKRLDGWNIQAFFPLPVIVKRKVAEVEIKKTLKGWWFYTVVIMDARCTMRENVKLRKSAIRAARRFCAAIGYEMELVK